MVIITVSYMIETVIEVNIWKDWIMKQVVIEFGSLKIDNGEDTVMCSYDNAY